MGQNFIIDTEALDRVIAAAEISPVDTILEIGAGLGALTLRLAARARQVIAVELDPNLFALLEGLFAEHANVRLVQGDILALDPGELTGGRPYQVVANIPYAITAALVRRLLESDHKADRLVLTVQREVGERIVAAPGQMSLLALSVQVYGEARIMARIAPRSFYPVPKVESVVLRVDMPPQEQVPSILVPALFQLAKAGFSQRRKQLRNALAAGLGVPKAQVEAHLRAVGISPTLRAQALGMPEWIRLAERAVETGWLVSEAPD
jgi:16S rRNA (adenine1518-N6/adenine1519-N6)-dimethyltransferase